MNKDDKTVKTVTLRSETRTQINEIASADIVIGIPSYNNARTIGHVVRAVQAGLEKYFPSVKAVIINSDGGSTDGSGEIVKTSTSIDSSTILLKHRIEPVAKISFLYPGLPGKGSAFRSIFEIAVALKARACAVVDADLRSITPEWIELLVKPVLENGFDYVAPLYHRHKYDGTITNSIVYPLTRALYGKRIRQPIGGDFGFSGELAAYFLSKDVWETDVARFGIDIWMTTTAMANSFKVSQAFLGAKIHDPRDPSADLSAMLFQVVGATFELMENYADIWVKVKGSETVPTFGFEYTVGFEHVPVKTSHMLENFRQGLSNLREIWHEVLGAGDLSELERIGKSNNESFNFPSSLWTRIIYDYAIAFHRKKLPKEHLIKSLTPLYLGKTASFVISMEHYDIPEVEADIENLCMEFETNKEYLVNNWELEQEKKK
jgi:glycosyltransferase involved in cell wall biosynthesis